MITDDYILKKYRGHQPSLVIHLHPTHFRFDNQEGSFTYKSPMRIVIEHLRTRTIPHDLMELMEEVPVYEGCMIVQVHDHKSIVPSRDQSRQTTSSGKATPFSVHNYNTFLTPSPYVPYPQEERIPSRDSGAEDVEDSKLKSSEQKDKENMPAPAVPGDVNRHKLSSIPRKPKISTIVLHPTPLSDHFSVATKANELVSANEIGRRESRADGPLSATVPPTPSTMIPPTPGLPPMPPSKRLKKNQADAATQRVYEAEMQVVRTTATPLILQTVNSAAESVELLKILAHPMHLEKPPSPKSRKRTVAEMAADEALAAEQERYMLLLDERLASQAAGAPGANSSDGTAQAGSGSFEPRFERFKVLANIRANFEEKARQEKINSEQRERKVQQDKERERLQKESEAREAQKAQSAESQRQAVQMQAARAAEMQRRQLAAQAQAHAQNMQNMPGQGQHAHPQGNNLMANGVQGQPQRFHQQQQAQAQVSSPIPRNGTPQNHSSPMASAMGNVPMQQSNSNMGNSPARPGSVVQQHHTPMVAPAMVQQRSQQSHAGTPRMPSATPNLQNTPLNRPMSQTPRMSQGSPLPGQVAQANGMVVLPNGQQVTTLQHQQMMQAQINRQRMVQAQAQASALAQQNPQLMNNQGQALQHQMQMMQAQQQRAAAAMGGNPNFNPQMAAAMAARQAQANNMMQNGNFISPGGQNMPPQVRMDPAQMQAMQQMQQASMQRAAHQQAQQAAVSQQQQAQQIFSQQVLRLSSALYNDKIQQYAQQYPQGVPEDIDRQLRVHCQQQATIQMKARRQQMMAQQQQQMMAAQGMGGMNGMGNGMGM